MKRGWWYRFLFLLTITGLSVLMIMPTALNLGKDDTFPVKSKITLGLDLQGGLYMTLGIDFNKVYLDEIKGYVRKFKDVLKEELIESELGALDLEEPSDPQYSVTIKDESKIEAAKDLIRKFYPGHIRLTKEIGNELTYALSDYVKKTIEEQSVTKSIEVIRNRIDEFGVTEPEIVSQGNDRIVVQLPGVKDIDRAKALIGKTAKLEFKLVNDEVAPSALDEMINKAKEAGIDFKEGDHFSDYLVKLNHFLSKDLPKGYELAFKKEVSHTTNKITMMEPYLLTSEAPLSGSDLQDAAVLIDQEKNEPYVSMEFKSSGAKTFEELTANNINKRMAIILDGNVVTAPNINSRIPGGRAQITLGTGNYNKTLKEARDIALVLRAGALPVTLDFLEQRIVGPSLGQDSIVKAGYAGLIGSAFVIIFIFVYYRIAGGIAVITLVLNILFIIAALISFEATLTLPGIAGMALTLGMAVDGNIIIYERIREEIRKGLTNYKAVESGFETAFWTILDSNITTALAGLALINFGAGPIKGFAVTLLIGIVSTVYCSYFVGKLLFEFYMNKVEGQELSI